MRRALLSVLAVLALPASAQAASVSNPPKSLFEGAAFGVTSAANGKGAVRYYLSSDGRHDIGDLRLIGHGVGKVKLTVPYTVPTGAMHLLACIGEKCAASKGTTKVGTKPKDRSIPRTLADQHQEPQSDALFLSLAGIDRSACPAPSSKTPKPPSLKSAIAKAQAKLDKAGGANGRRLFKRSSASKSADKAEGAAARALIAGQPGGALEALLQAHRLAPRDPAYLVDAADVMASVGMARESLALLDAADQLDPRRSTPFGINNQALALNAHGYALIALGRFAEAEKYLRAAVALDPYFSEAKTNLGIALLCKKDDKGILFARAGQYRFLGDAVIDNPGDPFEPPANQADALDLSAGQQPTIPQYKLPKTVEDASALRDTYFAQQQEFLARSQARHKRVGDLIGQETPLNALSQQRYLDLSSSIARVPLRPDIEAVAKRLTDRQTEIGQYMDDTFQGFIPGSRFPTWQQEASDACKDAPDYQTCWHGEYLNRCYSTITSAHQHWLGLMDAQLTDYAALVKLYYPLQTGIAAHISDPERHELESLQIDDLPDSQFNTWIPTYAGFWATYVRNSQCHQDAGPSEQPGPAQPETPHSPACPDFLKGVKFGWKIGSDAKLGVPFDISLEVACEKVSLEVSGKVVGGDNWIGAFGEISYAPGAGKVTVFGGPKAGVKIPGTSLGGSFKDGIYVTVGSDGIRDVGFRASPSVEAGLDQLRIKGSDSEDFSFAHVFGLQKR